MNSIEINQKLKRTHYMDAKIIKERRLSPLLKWAGEKAENNVVLSCIFSYLSPI